MVGQNPRTLTYLHLNQTTKEIISYNTSCVKQKGVLNNISQQTIRTKPNILVHGIKNSNQLPPCRGTVSWDISVL